MSVGYNNLKFHHLLQVLNKRQLELILWDDAKHLVSINESRRTEILLKYNHEAHPLS